MTKPMMTALDRLSQSNADKAAALMAFLPDADYSKLTQERADLGRKPFGWGVDLAAPRTVTGRMKYPQMQVVPRTPPPNFDENGNPVKPNAEFVKAPLRTGHQGYMAYEPDHVRKLAGRVAAALPKVMADLNADTVVVTGKSGISIAYAALMLIDFPLVTVRKQGEKVQGCGSQVEGRSGHEMRRYIVLDDLVSTGSTVDNIHRALVKRCGNSYSEPECVGVLVYGDYGVPYASRTEGGIQLNVVEARRYTEN